MDEKVVLAAEGGRGTGTAGAAGPPPDRAAGRRAAPGLPDLSTRR